LQLIQKFSIDHQTHDPFDWHFEHLASAAEPHSSNVAKGDISPLTSQTTALVRLALNLWNSHKFDLAEGLAIWDSDLYKVALQALYLRRRKPELIIQ
jgi:hypothetical protein